MYSPAQQAAMRGHPDRPRLLADLRAAFTGLSVATPTAEEVFARIAAGTIEVLFDDTLVPSGGMTPGENPVVLGGRGLLGRPNAATDDLLTLLLSAVHEGVHRLDVEFGRVRPGAAATAGERFFTELHAYTAEYELAAANGMTHLLAPEFRGVQTLDDIANCVLTVEPKFLVPLRRQPGVEAAVLSRVAAMFPTLP